ncbi:uncharacterized protein LOC120542756 isoform X2 [Polypterus senegalus]|nr:uncharacterized protein LOC120542756 isoform X2 [Polypterus senegalus]XP_039631333.1 uncharacterized protein LOC120542756 isoform X2 [Polypterus senegalus]XP_039631334.1 uncharacterized protein LOC120542756 isoform X2 [Polypterus senegalus]
MVHFKNWKNIKSIRLNMSDFNNSDNSTNQNYNIEKDILFLDISSRATYCYTLFVMAGLIASTFICKVFVRNCRGGRNFEKLDILFYALNFTDMIILLFSFSVIAYRPKYLQATMLECGILSFFFNMFYFNSQFLHVSVAFFLIVEERCANVCRMRIAVDSAFVWIVFAAVCALFSSLLEAALLGFEHNLNKTISCQLDPLQAKAQYDITKFVTSIVIPYILLMISLLVCCFMWKRPDHKSTMKARLRVISALLAVALVTLVCRLFYNCVLISRAIRKLHSGNDYPKHEEALMCVAELVMFSGSCISLVLVIFLYKPYQEQLSKSWRHLREFCRRITHRDNHRNIMEPTIEIVDKKEETASMNLEEQEGDNEGVTKVFLET